MIVQELIQISVLAQAHRPIEFASRLDDSANDRQRINIVDDKRCRAPHAEIDCVVTFTVEMKTNAWHRLEPLYR